MLGSWQSASPFVLLRRSIVCVRRLLLIFVIASYLTFHWVGLKPFRHHVLEFFDKRVGFCWRAYKNMGIGYTCVDLVIGHFTDITGTTTPLTAFDERGIIYLVVTNVGWLPYLVDKHIQFVHYSTNRVRRQFGLD